MTDAGSLLTLAGEPGDSASTAVRSDMAASKSRSNHTPEGPTRTLTSTLHHLSENVETGMSHSSTRLTSSSVQLKRDTRTLSELESRPLPPPRQCVLVHVSDGEERAIRCEQYMVQQFECNFLRQWTYAFVLMQFHDRCWISRADVNTVAPTRIYAAAHAGTRAIGD